jgi:hypothetical protein
LWSTDLLNGLERRHPCLQRRVFQRRQTPMIRQLKSALWFPRARLTAFKAMADFAAGFDMRIARRR